MQTVHCTAVGEIGRTARVYSNDIPVSQCMIIAEHNWGRRNCAILRVIHLNTAGTGSAFPCQAIGDGLKHSGAISTGPFSKGLVMTETVLISVRLPGSVAEAANAAAASRNISRSKLLRIAIERFLDDLSGSSEQDRRRQFSAEYTFLALDLMVQREYPEVHDELLTEAERRMEVFHGGA